MNNLVGFLHRLTESDMNRWGSSGSVPVPGYKPVQKHKALAYMTIPQWLMSHVMQSCNYLSFSISLKFTNK